MIDTCLDDCNSLLREARLSFSIEQQQQAHSCDVSLKPRGLVCLSVCLPVSL